MRILIVFVRKLKIGAQSIINSFKSRVIADGGILEGESCLKSILEANYTQSTTLNSISLPEISYSEAGYLMVVSDGEYYNSTENPLEITYQWYKDNIRIVGETSNILYFTETGSYSCRVSVSNIENTVKNISNTFSINIPILITPPVLYFDSEINKLVSSSGTYEETIATTFSYKWFFNDVLVEGAMSNTYTPSGAGNFKCEVTATNYFGTISNLTQVLTLQQLELISAPSIAEGSTEIILTDGVYNYPSGISFSYKWFKNGVLTDVTTKNYPTTVAEYYCEVTATSPLGSVITNTNTIIIEAATLFEINTNNTNYANTTANNQYRLCLVDAGPLDITVFWGDDTSSVITSFDDPNLTHTYSSSGIYNVRIAGELRGLQHIPYTANDSRKITKVLRVDGLNITGTATFGQCLNMVWLAPTAPIISTTNLSRTFEGCYIFNANINDWDVSNVTNMSSMFSSAYIFNQPLNNWNTGNVTNMSNMFDNAAGFNQPLNNWNTGNVTNMRNMFNTAGQFNQDISSWDVSSVTDMGYMFFYAFGFNQPLNNWNTGNVTNMSDMFYGAYRFNQPLNNWNTGNVTNMNSMFNGASGFNQDISSWDVSNVTNMGYMFSFASGFNQPINNWNTGNVTNMSYMFNGATGFNQPLNNWNTGNVTNMGYMFYGAYRFNQPLNNWNTGNVTNMNSMFNGATGFNQPLNNWNTGNVTNMSSMFNGATGFNQDISSWDVSSVTNFLDFMNGKTSETYSASYLDAIYNGWSSRPVQPDINIHFGSIIYTEEGQPGKDILLGAPNNWTITDGITNNIPINDTCPNAIPIESGDILQGSTINATDTGGNLAGDLWYSYSGPAGTITVSLDYEFTDFDTYLRVYDACGGNQIAFNDDAASAKSIVIFQADGTTTYYIMVEGYGSNIGNFEISLNRN